MAHQKETAQRAFPLAPASGITPPLRQQLATTALFRRMPRRFYAGAAMGGKWLQADACTSTGDTLLSVLASPLAKGGSWTFCAGNDGEWPGWVADCAS